MLNYQLKDQVSKANFNTYKRIYNWQSFMKRVCAWNVNFTNLLQQLIYQHKVDKHLAANEKQLICHIQNISYLGVQWIKKSFFEFWRVSKSFEEKNDLSRVQVKVSKLKKYFIHFSTYSNINSVKLFFKWSILFYVIRLNIGLKHYFTYCWCSIYFINN